MKHLRRLYPVVVIFFFSFCFFGITQKVSSSKFYCGDQYPKLTKIRNVIIDNYITGYNIVISNGLYVGKIVNAEDSSSKSIIQCGDSPISIFKTEPIYISTSFGTIGKNINKGLEGNVDVYLIPDYFQDEDFIVADCTGYISNSLITDRIHSKIYTLPNSNFDYEKYKIGTISSDRFVNEVDFHEIETTVDRYCAELTDETQYITYHYNIQKIGNDYKLQLSKIEKNGNIILSYLAFLYSKAKEYKYYTFWSIVEVLILLFFGIKSVNKNNDKIQNKKLRLTLGSLGIIILNFICVIGFSLMKIRLFVAVFALVANIMLFKYTLFIKWKYAILLGIFCSIILILGLLWLFLG